MLTPAPLGSATVRWARLPTMHSLREQVEAGGLLVYAADPADLYRCGALYVDRIIKGTAPGELPIEQLPLTLTRRATPCPAAGSDSATGSR